MAATTKLKHACTPNAAEIATEHLTTCNSSRANEEEMETPEINCCQLDKTTACTELDVPMHVATSVTEDDDSQRLCRICYGDSSEGTLIQPCNCKGTLENVHRECLGRWLQERRKIKCDICDFNYRYTWYFLPWYQWHLPDPLFSIQLFVPILPHEEIFLQFVSFFCAHIAHYYLAPNSFLDMDYRQCLLFFTLLLVVLFLVTFNVIIRWIKVNTFIFVMDKRDTVVSTYKKRWFWLPRLY